MGGEDGEDGEDGGERWLRTGMRSLYFWRMRSASALRFSNGCSSLNLERILGVDRASGRVYVCLGGTGISSVAREGVCEIGRGGGGSRTEGVGAVWEP